MERDELVRQIASIKAECEVRIGEMKLKYAKANQKHERGDVIQTKNNTGERILIEKIKYSLITDEPEAVYYGPWLKKDGTPNKKHEINYIYQSNIK